MSEIIPDNLNDLTPLQRALVSTLAKVYYGGDVAAAWRATLAGARELQAQVAQSPAPLPDAAEVQLRIPPQ